MDSYLQIVKAQNVVLVMSPMSSGL